MKNCVNIAFYSHVILCLFVSLYVCMWSVCLKTGLLRPGDQQPWGGLQVAVLVTPPAGSRKDFPLPPSLPFPSLPHPHTHSHTQNSEHFHHLHGNQRPLTLQHSAPLSDQTLLSPPIRMWIAGMCVTSLSLCSFYLPAVTAAFIYYIFIFLTHRFHLEE